MVRDRVAVVGFCNVVFTKSAIVRRRSGEDRICAEIVLPRATIVTANALLELSNQNAEDRKTYCLHGTPGSIATLSPTFTFFTRGPTSTTVPELS